MWGVMHWTTQSASDRFSCIIEISENNMSWIVGNGTSKTVNASRVVWQVVPSCWIHMSSRTISFNWGTDKWIIILVLSSSSKTQYVGTLLDLFLLLSHLFLRKESNLIQFSVNQGYCFDSVSYSCTTSNYLGLSYQANVNACHFSEKNCAMIPPDHNANQRVTRSPFVDFMLIFLTKPVAVGLDCWRWFFPHLHSFFVVQQSNLLSLLDVLLVEVANQIQFAFVSMEMQVPYRYFLRLYHKVAHLL